MFRLRDKSGDIFELDKGVLTGDNPVLVEWYSVLIEPSAISGYTPDTDASLADIAVTQYGMEIIYQDAPPEVPEYPYTVY